MRSASILLFLMCGVAFAHGPEWQLLTWSKSGIDIDVAITHEDQWDLDLILVRLGDEEPHIISEISFDAMCEVQSRRYAIDRTEVDLVASPLDRAHQKILERAGLGVETDAFQILTPSPESTDFFWTTFENAALFAIQLELRNCSPESPYWESVHTFIWGLGNAADAVDWVRGPDEDPAWLTRTNNAGTAFEYADASASVDEGPDETFLILADREGRLSLELLEHTPPQCESHELQFFIDRERVPLMVTADERILFPPDETAGSFWRDFASGDMFEMHRLMRGCAGVGESGRYDETRIFRWKLGNSAEAIDWVSRQ